jgi:hypothetical protein
VILGGTILTAACSVVAFQYIGDSNACDVFPSRCWCEYDREKLLGFPLQSLLFSLKKYEEKLIVDFNNLLIQHQLS